MTRRAFRSNRLVVWILLALIAPTAACQRDPLERARSLQSEKKFEESAEPLREALKERPEDPEANFRYGVALIATGQHSLALWSLRKAMESPEWLEQAGIPLATTAIRLGNYDEAISATTRVLEHHPDLVDALLLRSEARVRSRRQYSEALADAERVLESDPDNKGAMVPKVASLLALGRTDEAAAALDSLEGSYRDDELGLHGSPALCAARATFAKEKQQNEEAERRFDECLKQFPSDGMIVHEAVAFFDGLGRGDRSEAVLQAALAASPDTFDFRAALVERMRATGRESEAKALLTKATELSSPASAAVGWASLALYSIETGDFAEGARAFEQARALDPSGSADILFGYADALVIAGRTEEALDVAEQMTVPAHRALVEGRVALARGELERALSLFSQANRLWPNNAVARYYTAAAAEQLGQFERASEEYRYSIRIDVRATDAYLRLARMEQAAGRIEEALVPLQFQPGGRPSEDQAALLELELLASTNRPPPPEVLARLQAKQRSAGAAAVARGLAKRLGPTTAVTFLRAQKDIDLRDPVNADSIAELVAALGAAKKGREALAHLESAVKAHPDSAVLLALRGDARATSGGAEPAIRADYQRALTIDPAQHRAVVGLAGLEARAGAAESALALYERAAKTDPSDRAAVREAAKLLVGLGKADVAETRLTELLREYPWDAPAAMALAELQSARGADPVRAKALAKRAVVFGGGPPAQALLDRLEGATPPTRAQGPSPPAESVQGAGEAAGPG
jgi:tetratricopeptide (TPR) repeat protein